MQVSTSLFYDRAASAMSSLSAKADRLNTQISTEKKFSAPSDDSVAYQRLQGLARAGADDTAYGANVGLAQSIMAQADTGLRGIGDQLKQASELAIRAGSGTLTAEARASIADQLAGIVDDIVTQANVKDVRGASLFGGAAGSTAVTRSGNSLTFETGAGAAIPIGDGQSVQPSANAAAFLAIGSGDVASVIGALVDQLRGGDAVDASGAIADLSTAGSQVDAARAFLGARAARVDLEAARLKDTATDREATRSGIEDTDVTQTYLELQKTMTVLSATQASFTKLTSLSLFDQLR